MISMDKVSVMDFDIALLMKMKAIEINCWCSNRFDWFAVAVWVENLIKSESNFQFESKFFTGRLFQYLFPAGLSPSAIVFKTSDVQPEPGIQISPELWSCGSHVSIVSVVSGGGGGAVVGGAFVVLYQVAGKG